MDRTKRTTPARKLAKPAKKTAKRWATWRTPDEVTGLTWPEACEICDRITQAVEER